MLQRLTYITTFLPYDTLHDYFRKTLFTSMKLFFRAATPEVKQDACINENLDYKNEKLQSGDRMIGTPISMEKLDTCLQQLTFTNERTKIPEPNKLVFTGHGSAFFAKEAKAWQSQKFEGSQVHCILITQLNLLQAVWGHWQ